MSKKTHLDGLASRLLTPETIQTPTASVPTSCNETTLRDHFAAKSIQGICADDHHGANPKNHAAIAAEAYKEADSMLAALNLESVK